MAERFNHQQEDPARTAALNELVEKGIFSEEDAAQIRREDQQESKSSKIVARSSTTSAVVQLWDEKDQRLEKVARLKEESGVGEVLRLFEATHGRYAASERKDKQKGTIEYILVNEERNQSYIKINSKGTIIFSGRYLIGRTKLKEKKWRENPELIGKAAAKALRHPNIMGV